MGNDTYEIRTTFSESTKAEIEFSKDKILPLLPEKLVGKDIPPFVVSWLIETDVIGWIIQDFLAAPTRSFCRIYCKDETAITDSTGDSTSSEPIEGLPKGIKLPENLLVLIENAKKLECWLNSARKVAEWAEDQGAGDEPWLKTD